MLCAMRTYSHTGGNLPFLHGFSIRSVNIPLVGGDRREGG